MSFTAKDHGDLLRFNFVDVLSLLGLTCKNSRWYYKYDVSEGYR